ncbi:MAG TPA: amidohydrolase family protein [Chitinophagales bacterium]|nr:amidohydrolase family protein [Chitinophagales bacterium]
MKNKNVATGWRKVLCIAALLIFATTESLYAQRIVPAPPQDSIVILTNGRAHIGNGQVIENSAIGFEKGRITFVADATTVRLDLTGARVIDVGGKDVYPGLITPNSELGLREIEAVRATVDKAEVGQFNPAVRSLTSYNTDSRVVPTVRANGVLLAQVAPAGGVVSGTSSIVQLDAWNWEDAAYKTDDGVWLTWPFYNPFKPEEQDKYKQQVTSIELFFNQSKAYRNGALPEKNVQFEAMKGLWQGEQKLFIRASTSYQITAAVLFARKMNLRCVIVGGEESYKTLDVLKQNNVSVILNRVQSLPLTPDDDYDQPYKTPAVLQQNGILFSMSMDVFWQDRNQPFNAGHAAGFGLTPEQALSSVTMNAAKILGIDDRTGTLEAGKDANIVVSTGDILDMRTNNVELAFIQGRQILLTDKQKQLYEIYKKKYRLD